MELGGAHSWPPKAPCTPVTGKSHTLANYNVQKSKESEGFFLSILNKTITFKQSQILILISWHPVLLIFEMKAYWTAGSLHGNKYSNKSNVHTNR